MRSAVAPLMIAIATLVSNMATPGGAQTVLDFCYDPYPPYTLGTEGTAKGGLKVKLLDAVVAEIDGLEARVTILPWQRCLLMAKEGQIDGLLPLFKNDERSEFLSFSAAAFLQTSSFWFRKGEDFDAEISGLTPEAPTNLRMGMISGSIIDAKMEQSFAEIARLQTVEQLFRMLEFGRLDLIAIDDAVGRYVVHQTGLTDVIVRYDTPISEQSSFFGLSKASGADTYLDEFNRALKKLTDTGVVARITSGSP